MKRIGIIGGSGLYDMEGFEGREDVYVDTPFGAPSDALTLGTLAGVPVAFVARHGRGHRYLPSEVPYHANIYALKKLGCTALISVSVTGSMREDIRPGDLVLIDQFIDRTRSRPKTFFGKGIAAHAGFADPLCGELRALLAGVAESELPDVTVHVGGTYVCIEGPQFSTRAESLLYRSWDVAVIGMTNIHEARLAREAELPMQTIALATDYDCWHEGEADVSVEEVLKILRGNIDKAKRFLRAAMPALKEAAIDQDPAWTGSSALQGAIMTAPQAIPSEARARLDLLIGRYL